jgi:ankyrin repeat protein
MSLMAVAILLGVYVAQAQNQGGVPATFTPSIEQKVDARSVPAKVTSEEESALTTKGYVNIGSINAGRPGEKEDADITGQLRAAILKKAAEAGGDVVRFEKEGVPETLEVPTGKFKTKGATCDQYQSVATSTTSSSTSCYTDVHGFQHCMTTNTPGFGTAQKCVKWSGGQSVPITKREKSLVSVGTVWRYDSKLAADVATHPLHDAARNGKMGVAESLLEAGVQVDARDSAGNTALHEAAMIGSQGMAELLLAHGADVNARSKNGGTPLLFAASMDTGTVGLLLAHGADVNAKDDGGESALARAAAIGKAATVELLLAHGADVNAKDNRGHTPLLEAAAEGKEDVAESLLAHGANVNAKDNDGDTALSVAFSKKHQDLVDLLRQHGGHATEAVEEAARKEETAREEANRKFKAWEEGCRLLHDRLSNGQRDQEELLVAHGADLNDWVIRDGEDWSTCLHHAVRGGEKDAAEWLLAHGADVNALDINRKTPLHCAAEIGREDMAELLLAHGANVNAKDNIDQTPLHYAAENGREEVAEFLLAHGADVNARKLFGDTPLDVAAKKEQKDMVRLLRKHGARK